MPRQLASMLPGFCSMLWLEGSNRGISFLKKRITSSLPAGSGHLLNKTGTDCYAWALIPNHFHLLLRTGPTPLATVMRRLLTSYSVFYNRCHRRSGHLCQNRYKSILCEEDPYLLELVRYIHLNPIRSGLVKDLVGLVRYPWCGDGVLMGRCRNPWQNTKEVLVYF